MRIDKLFAREILDSRGFPTVEVDLILDDGSFGRAAVPSGASVGSKEALELRDNDPKRYLGKGVLKAVDNVNHKIAKHVFGRVFNSFQDLDSFLISLDGTDNKSELGANAILAVSMAFARAQAAKFQTPLYALFGSSPSQPRPMMNIVNGGAHADNPLDFQEFMIVPLSHSNISDAVRMGSEVFHTLKKLLKDKKLNTNVGDEGGFAPNLGSPAEVLEIIVEAIKKAGYKPAQDIAIALDVAASEFYKDGKYYLDGLNLVLTPQEMVTFYQQLCDQFPIISIEDGMSEFDELGWKLLTQQLGSKIQLVGDDLFVTNKLILADGIRKNLANSILIKLNQVGTLSETLETIALARNNGYSCIISHRSGETEDSFISHLAYGTGVGQIKTGSLCRSDRMAKYNELIRIEIVI